MSVYITQANYSDYKFKSVFSPVYYLKFESFDRNIVRYEALHNILTVARDANKYLNWDTLLELNLFRAPKPTCNELPPEPQEPTQPQEPNYSDIDPNLLKITEKPVYIKPQINLHSLQNKYPKLANFIKNTILKLSEVWYSIKLGLWEKRKNDIQKLKKGSSDHKGYIGRLENHKKDIENFKKAHYEWKLKQDEAAKLLKSTQEIWGKNKSEFDVAAKDEHDKLVKLKSSYEKADAKAIAAYIELILFRSPYPFAFPRQAIVNYDEESKIVIIDFQLPDFERISIQEETKRFDIKEINKTKRKEIIQSTLPAIALRTLYEIAVNDEINCISSIVFNGWMNFIDKRNGNERNECILSLHALKNEMTNLIIDKIEPKECFKALKGVIAKNILEYIPVAPILVMNKNDKRIIEGRKIIEGLTAKDNLAAMDWGDFEHLIRELFEREFSQHGAEVKITHASHDRGVDAIIYDPDPIRGGKFIVQAKRYTRLVDVSAVRDLYGAIQNENANRGILVTTSHYGPDAYEFAKDKNITLLTGENLLHLLEKHGYKFRIDIKEARKLLNLK